MSAAVRSSSIALAGPAPIDSLASPSSAMAMASPSATSNTPQSIALDLTDVGAQAALTVHPSSHSPHAYAPPSYAHPTSSHSQPSKHVDDSSSSAAYLSAQLSSGFDTTFFTFNDASSLTQYFITTGIAKAHSAIWPRFISGLLSGLFVAFGAIFALVAAGGLSADLRSASPAIPKIVSGVTFPIALVLIMFVGGDLFTGNCMYVGLGVFTGRVSLRQALNVLLVSFFSNLCGCLLFSYLLGYRTELFSAEPYNSWVLAVANGKVGLEWGVVVLRAIGANALVCIGIFMGSSSRDALGRFVIAWIPVLVFSVIGFEHVVANMAFIPIALFYGGTNFSTAQYITRSMLPAALGNIIGGGILLGGFLAYMYTGKGRTHTSVVGWLRYHLVPEQSVLAIVGEMSHQLLHDLPIDGASAK